MSFDIQSFAAQVVSPLPNGEKLQWIDLSFKTAYAACRLQPCHMNAELDAAAQSAGQSPIAPAYRLWIADNMNREGQYHNALAAFDTVLETAARAEKVAGDPDFSGEALAKKAASAARIHDVDLSIRTYRELAAHAGRKDVLFKAGHVAETAQRLTEAARLYQEAITEPPTVSASSRSELARRALARLSDREAVLSPQPETLSDQLVTALHDGNSQLLRRLLSRTHFSVGMPGGEFTFEEEEVLETLLSEFGQSRVVTEGNLEGSGKKRYLLTGGWRGQWFQGSVGFALLEGPRGWQVSGIVLHQPGDPWMQKWIPQYPSLYTPPTYPPPGYIPPPPPYVLPIEIKSPWPAGKHMMAGGLIEYAAKVASIAAAGWPFGAALAAYYASSRCGFGPGGFYYGQGRTHSGVHHYAIDFTRYRRFLPLPDNESGGVPVLAIAPGRVLGVEDGIDSGDSHDANEVILIHTDPETMTERFLSRYMHMKGPHLIGVSTNMIIPTGTRLGEINDTGTSVYDHLHFSVHDQNETFTPAKFGCNGVRLGTSVPPSPMDGNRPGDGKCMGSSNVDLGPDLTPTPPPPTYYNSGASFGIGIDNI